MRLLFVLHYLAAFCTLTNTYRLSLFGGRSRRGQSLGIREMKVNSGCQQDFAGTGAFASIVVDEGNNDFGNVVIFFEGDDCKPSNIMQSGAAFVFEDGCWTGNYGSYEVWGLWKVEG